MELLPLILVGAAAIWVVLKTNESHAREVGTLRDAALANGFALAGNTADRRIELMHFKQWSKNIAPEVDNFYEQRVGAVDFLLLEYEYTRQAYHRGLPKKLVESALVVSSPEMPAVGFEVFPKHYPGSHQLVEDFFGSTKDSVFPEVDFSMHPSFSENYVVYGLNADTVRKVVSSTLMPFLETRTGYHIESAAGKIMLFQRNVVADPMEVNALMACFVGGS